MMISENEYKQEMNEDDELSVSPRSTSVGGSDNEVNSPTSGEDEPPSCSKMALVAPQANDLGANPMLAAQVHLFLSTFFSILFMTLTADAKGIASLIKPQQPAKAPIPHASTLPARPQPQGRKAAKSSAVQRQPVRAPPGLSLPRREVVSPPPGLSLQCCETKDLSIEEVGPPPGLSLQATRLPPGLEVFSAPPGIFFPQSQKEATSKRTAQRNKNKANEARKRVSMAAASTQPVSTESPKLPSPPPPAVVVPREFEQAVYRKELSDVLRELAFVSSGSNVASSVRRIRAQNVPRERQAPEFRDILTRAAEENRGVVRRLSFAFAAGLAAGTCWAREECLSGIQLFFEDVFEDLASEVPRLRNKLANELAPTLRTVFSEEEISRLLPADCRTVQC